MIQLGAHIQACFTDSGRRLKLIMGWCQQAPDA
jgi:hypothetical protein